MELRKRKLQHEHNLSISSAPVKKLKWNHEYDFKLSLDPDLLTLISQKKDPCAVMPCGHTITPSSLLQLMDVEIIKGTKSVLKCPGMVQRTNDKKEEHDQKEQTAKEEQDHEEKEMKERKERRITRSMQRTKLANQGSSSKPQNFIAWTKCDCEWPLDLVARICSFNAKTIDLYRSKMSENYIKMDKNTHVCPFCSYTLDISNRCENNKISNCPGCMAIHSNSNSNAHSNLTLQKQEQEQNQKEQSNEQQNKEKQSANEPNKPNEPNKSNKPHHDQTLGVIEDRFRSKSGETAPLLFCVMCNNEWHNPTSTYICGNEECDSSVEKTLEILQNSPLARFWYCGSMFMVPKIRACPNRCGQLIEHTYDCHNMSCTKCLTDFCLACLSLHRRHAKGCMIEQSAVAPIQTAADIRELVPAVQAKGAPLVISP